jgi:hypothetical protein
MNFTAVADESSDLTMDYERRLCFRRDSTPWALSRSSEDCTIDREQEKKENDFSSEKKHLIKVLKRSPTSKQSKHPFDRPCFMERL